jgi:hypothetical protein
VEPFPTTTKLKREHFRLFPKGYWAPAVKDVSKVGDADANAIYQAMGYALVAWESLEDLLASLFLYIAESNDPHMSTLLSRTFGSIESSSARREVLKARMQVYLHRWWDMEEVVWLVEELMVALRVAAQRRNEIAHGLTVRFHPAPVDADGERAYQPSGVYLLSPRYMTGRNESVPKPPEADPLWVITSKYCYVARDILLMAEKFNNLRQAASKYFNKLRKGADGVPVIVNEILRARASYEAHRAALSSHRRSKLPS